MGAKNGELYLEIRRYPKTLKSWSKKKSRYPKAHALALAVSTGWKGVFVSVMKKGFVEPDAGTNAW